MGAEYTLFVMLFTIDMCVLLYTLFVYGRFLPRRVPYLFKCIQLVVIIIVSSALSFVSALLPNGAALVFSVMFNIVIGYLMNVVLVDVMLQIVGVRKKSHVRLLHLLYVFPLAGFLMMLFSPIQNFLIASVSKTEGTLHYAIVMHPVGEALAVITSLLLLLVFACVIFMGARKKTPNIDGRVVLVLCLSVLIPSTIKYIEAGLELLFHFNYRLSSFTQFIFISTLFYVYFGYLRSARKMAVDHTNEAFIVFDKWGTAVDMNHAAQSLFAFLGFTAPPSSAQLAQVLGLSSMEKLRQGDFPIQRDSETRYFNVSEFRLSNTINRHCGNGYSIREVTEYHKRMDALNTLAIKDALTGVNNRRCFYDIAAGMIERATMGNGMITLLMIDIDHFKHVNDTYGHSVGDEVLRTLCGIWASSLRKSDTLFRYGGEEFIVLCEDTTAADGRQMAERLRSATEQAPLQTSAGPIPVTISVGGCTYAVENGASIDQWVETADAHLYSAKNNGRNQTSYAAG